MAYRCLQQRLRTTLSLINHTNTYTYTYTRPISSNQELIRRIYTSVEIPVPQNQPKFQNNRNDTQNSQYNVNILQSRLWQIPSSGERVEDILNQFRAKGWQFSFFGFMKCLKYLRKFKRYLHCLEILDWMEKSGFHSSDTMHAFRLGMICKLNGVDEAEKYFDSLPLNAKSGRTYGALLNCYCAEKDPEKALALFRKMEEKNYLNDYLNFDNMIGLFIALGQPEKVPPLVQVMKTRGIPLSSRTYCLWIQSCRVLNDFDGLERVASEVEEQNNIRDAWAIHSNFAAAYIKAGQSQKAEVALKKLEDTVDNSEKIDRSAYHFLITLYASTGDLEAVTRVWGKLKSKVRVCVNVSYLAMIKALVLLNNFEGVIQCFKEWESSNPNYDFRIPMVVLGAYLRLDMLQEAEFLKKDMIDKVGYELWEAHVLFMNYYLEKLQFDSALRHLEMAINNKWKPKSEKLKPFLKYLEEEKDTDGAEELCSKFKKVRPLDSEAYLGLLRIYAAAGKTAPDIRQRLEEDGIEIKDEHLELLNKVVPGA